MQYSTPSMPRLRNQKGFSLLVVFILIAILMAVLAAFIASPGLRTGAVLDAKAAGQAAEIIRQGSMLEGTFMYVRGKGARATDVVYGTVPQTYAMLGAGGLLSQPQPDRAAFVSVGAKDGFWIYRNGSMRYPGVGNNLVGDYSFVLSNLTRSVCEQINVQLHGANAIPDAGLVADLIRSGATSDMTSTDLSGATGFTGWFSGCIATANTPQMYVYFHVVSAH